MRTVIDADAVPTGHKRGYGWRYWAGVVAICAMPLIPILTLLTRTSG